jgi:hypothetical protein
MSTRLARFLENRSNAIGANGANGTGAEAETATNKSACKERKEETTGCVSLYTERCTSVPLAPIAPLAAVAEQGGQDKPTVEADWTGDRAWIAGIRHALDEATKLAVLAEWVAAAGGETCGRTVMLPALHPHTERRLAESELRRVCRQFGLEVLEDEP